MTQNVNSPIEIQKGVVMNLAQNWQAAKVERYNRWQHNYSIQTCQQSAILGSAEARMIDMIPMVRKSKYFRHEVKKALNQLDTSTLEKWHDKFSSTKGSIVMQEIVDEAVQQLGKHVQTLYWAVKADLDKQRVPDAAIKAEVYTVAMLVDISCQVFDYHVAIGPRPGGNDMTEEEKQAIMAWHEKYTEGSDEKSPYYDADYERWIAGMRPTKLKMLMGIICQGVCGTWSHNVLGNVPMAKLIIVKKVTDLHFLDKVSLEGLINSGEYTREIDKLNRMNTIRDGQFEITIDLLDAVKAYCDGYDDEQIRQTLYDINPNANYLGSGRIDRIMNIVRMMRLMDEHPEAQAQFNELEEAWERGGRDEALRIHNERMERINREEKAAKKKGKKQTISFADDKEKEEMTEQEMLMARLADKFGKVGTFEKPKKEKAEVKIMAEAIDSSKEAGVQAKEFVFPDDLPENPIDSSKEAGAQEESHAEAPEPQPTVQLAIQPEERKRAARRWSKDEEDYVVDEIEHNHTSDATIGKMLHRTAAAIRQRYNKVMRERKFEASVDKPEPIEF